MAKRPHRFIPADCLDEISAIEADVQALVHGLTESQFHAPAKSGGWSIGLCLEHLILVAEAQLPAWRAACRGSGDRSLSLAAAYSWFERAMLYSMEPPYRWRKKSPAWAHPSARRSMEDTLRRFTAMHGELRRLIAIADTCLGGIRTPLTGSASHRVGFLIDHCLAHERRHIWQAWRVRASFTESGKRNRSAFPPLSPGPRFRT